MDAGRLLGLEIREGVLCDGDVRALLDAGWQIVCAFPLSRRCHRDLVSRWGNRDGHRCADRAFIGIRLGRGTARLIVTAMVALTTGLRPVVNASVADGDHDFVLVPGIGSPVGDLRAASIMGYVPGVTPSPVVQLDGDDPVIVTVGLDIETSQASTEGGTAFPLPHADITSIAISTSAPMTVGYGQIEEVCICITTVGKIVDASWAKARGAVILRADDSEQAAFLAREALAYLNPDFVSVFNGYSFDFVRLACALACVPGADAEFEERMLGNTGSGVTWSLPNGITCVDPRYFFDKTERFAWKSLSLSAVSEGLRLPPKMTGHAATFSPGKDDDVSALLEYNCRDADLHAAVAVRSGMIAKLLELARCSWSSMWDSAVNNTGVMVFCMMSRAAMQRGLLLDCGQARLRSVFRGGFVMEPHVGLHRNVAVLDGRALYPSIMREVSIFIDNTLEVATASEAARALPGIDLAALEAMPEDTILTSDGVLIAFNGSTYSIVLPSENMFMRSVIHVLGARRAAARTRSSGGDPAAEAQQWAYKILAVSIYGSMGSSNGILSSRACSSAITCCGRAYVKQMALASRSMGFDVVYGDTDSVFISLRHASSESLDVESARACRLIQRSFAGTPFAGIEIKVDGTFASACMVAKKCYTLMGRSGLVTRGLAPARNDSPRVVSSLVTACSTIVHTSRSRTIMTSGLIAVIGIFAEAVEAEVFPIEDLVGEMKVDGKVSFVFRDKAGATRTVAVEAAPTARDVSSSWVLSRCLSSIEGNPFGSGSAVATDSGLCASRGRCQIEIYPLTGTGAGMAAPAVLRPLQGALSPASAVPHADRVVLPSMYVHMPLRRSLVDDALRSGKRACISEPLEETAGAPAMGFMFGMALAQTSFADGDVVDGVPRLLERPLVAVRPGTEIPQDEVEELVQGVGRGWVDRSRSLMTGLDIGMEVPTSFRPISTVVCYRNRTPLTVYNVSAAVAAADAGEDCPWAWTFPPLEQISLHSGIYGVIHDNTVVDLGGIAGSDDEPDFDIRRPSVATRGFLCAAYTPLTKAAGRVRALTIGSRLRIPDEAVMRAAAGLFEIAVNSRASGIPEATAPDSTSWSFRWRSLITVTCGAAVRDMELRSMRMSRTSLTMPIVHVFLEVRVAVISTECGTVLNAARPGRDSMTSLIPGTQGEAAPDSNAAAMAFFSPLVSLIPFAHWSQAPRITLGMQMARQALNFAPVSGDATFTATYSERPWISTPVCMSVAGAAMGGTARGISMPGITLVTAFVNMWHNMEDSCVVSETAASSGIFAWRATFAYPIPAGAGGVAAGSVLEKESWRRPDMPGTVESVFVSKSGKLYANVVLEANHLRVGDKIGTVHGMKFTVGLIMPDRDMPVLRDCANGELFLADLLISTASLARGIGGQVTEMRTIYDISGGVASFRAARGSHATTVIDEAACRAVPEALPEAAIMFPESCGVPDTVLTRIPIGFTGRPSDGRLAAPPPS